MVAKRLPSTPSLTTILPKGAEGGKEFARIVNLLLIHEARRRGQTLTHLDDAAGDFAGLDSFAVTHSATGSEKTGYQYKFYPSPLTSAHRSAIKKSLKNGVANIGRSQIKKWVIVTPDDFVESATREDGGDITWFESLRSEFHNIEIEQWGHHRLIELFLETRSLCLLYYPQIVPDGAVRVRTIGETRRKYDTRKDHLTR